MELIPAIDILERQVVRLHKGKYTEATVFSDDPIATSLPFVQVTLKASLLTS